MSSSDTGLFKDPARTAEDRRNPHLSPALYGPGWAATRPGPHRPRPPGVYRNQGNEQVKYEVSAIFETRCTPRWLVLEEERSIGTTIEAAHHIERVLHHDVLA